MRDRDITDYVIVKEFTVDRFQKEVQAMIGAGWQPYGPPVMGNIHDNLKAGLTFLQPMVKYSSSPPSWWTRPD